MNIIEIDRGTPERHSADRVTLTIDGQSISVPAGADGVPGLAEALKSHTAAVKN